jgi:hypothetical protein
VWTVNDEAEMRRLVGMGVQAILTDRPDRLLALLGRKRSYSAPGAPGSGLELMHGQVPLARIGEHLDTELERARDRRGRALSPGRMSRFKT